MNAVIKAKDRYAAEYELLAAGLAGHDVSWLRELRTTAMGGFGERGFPTSHDEDWKYTRTAAIEKRSFRCRSADGAVEMDRIANVLGSDDGPRLVLVNGRHFPALSRLDGLAAGVTFASLNGILRTDPNVLQGLYGKVVGLGRHPLAALNTAFADQGVYLDVRDGATPEKPFQVMFISTAAQDGYASHPRLLVRIGANAQATLVERYIALDDSVYFNNVIAEIQLEDGAALDHYRVQEEGEKAFHVSGVHVRQGRSSRYHGHGVAFGSGLLRNDIDVQLDAEGAHCDLTGLNLVDGRRHVDVHTRIDHRRPHGTSNEFYKVILDGQGRGVFNGKLIVHPDAQKTDARQINNNLLLSDDAEADSKPQLEIYADDVKCSHGATVGQLDVDALFYLRSRGVDEATSRRLLTHAFAAEIIEQVRLPALRAYLDAAVLARLPKENT